VLRGSDPDWKDTCVIVSAHYDHLGLRANSRGDNIFNGANDDASGVAGVVAIAKALASQASRPKRSVVFLDVFGEERGLLGSRYYVRHPVFPLAKTIADINLEQIGRTDSTQGPRLHQFNLTGYDYTTLPAVFEKASQETDAQVVKDAANTERYFTGSDNLSFAEMGVPSTTVSVTYQFPDYHAPGDEWAKLDYENMAKVVGTVAATVFQLADRTDAPQWNPENPQAARYRKTSEEKR
jgi:Zn-dependent M28 family amino/carboxypeptidase